ncbi:MAG: twin transmembrane helix small protein [Alphaproteobacteria bacterium]|nr:twin transmembrane helix small protein [Alphaproteobacteria bacterium]
MTATSVLSVLIVIALAVTLGVLGVGVVSMLRGGEFNRRYGNKLMQARVASQGVTIALIVIYFLVERG